jgi:hypothetical protein
VGEDHYTVSVDDGAIDVRRGDIGTPQFVLTGSVDAIAELLYLGGGVDAAAAAESVWIDGVPADVAAPTPGCSACRSRRRRAERPGRNVNTG